MTVALELRAGLLLTFVLSLAYLLALFPLDVFALLAFVPIHGVAFHWCFSNDVGRPWLP